MTIAVEGSSPYALVLTKLNEPITAARLKMKADKAVILLTKQEEQSWWSLQQSEKEDK